MHKEKTIKATSGWLMLPLLLVFFAASIWVFIMGVPAKDPMRIAGGCLGFVVSLTLMAGFFIVNPKEAAALLLFGDYKGSVKANGFFWTNPFMTKQKISLRARNLNGEKIKVNDSTGNPIEIATVVVWEVVDTAEALFEVDDYREYVETQSEAAVRHLASTHPYDGPDDVLTLRGTTEEINERLERELQERLNRAGVNVIEARLSHLAYASEIAGAMLQRQQAAAVVAARQQIVEGAVGMVELALDELAQKGVVHLDDERKAAMVSNLMVVLCSDHAATPVVNAGTLYQ
ncbi:SPFH domain-containing protein [bacterium]|nr:SPFH domain-containing protein [bacterium]HPF34359.1 SPFH domain-containing protein [Candidatus Krumholzibacteria bacterium]HRX49865.1 SPFH domain-containing protein [Candidatus Krumholzibacteria bacterium]